MKKLLILVLVAMLSLCSCSDSESDKNSNKDSNDTSSDTKVVEGIKKDNKKDKKDAKSSKENLLDKLEGYWICHEGSDGEEFAAFAGNVFTRGIYSTNGNSANITESKQNDDGTLTITFTGNEEESAPFPYSGKRTKYVITLSDEYNFDSHFVLDDGMGEYHFYRVDDAKNMCNFMLNSNNPRISQINSLAVAYAPHDYLENPLCNYMEPNGLSAGIPIIFYTDGRVKDFELVNVTLNGAEHIFGETIYSEKILSDDKYITVPVVFPEFTATLGVRFKDSEGIYKECTLTQSGRNGAVSLTYERSVVFEKEEK